MHEVLELVDPGAPDLAAHLQRLAVQRGARSVLATARDGVREGSLVADRLTALGLGLEAALSTPLGPLAGGVRLRDLPVADRLCEVEFELPLAGGDLDPPERMPRLGDVAELLARYLRPADPLAAYPAMLADLAAGDGHEQGWGGGGTSATGRLAGAGPGGGAAGEVLLRGYLTGSLDAVLRLRTPSGPRYLVVDYKTNRLAPPGEPLTAAHYRAEALAGAMCAAHYPLQLVLYLVALHRFLRWRQRGYDPEVHLGGGLYLFLRGMCGPDTPAGPDGTPAGVFGWRPPTGLVLELSALLDGHRTGPGASGPGGREARS